MMNPNAEPKGSTVDRIENLFASVVSSAYEMGADRMPIAALADLHIAGLQALAAILTKDVEDKKNQQAACN